MNNEFVFVLTIERFFINNNIPESMIDTSINVFGCYVLVNGFVSSVLADIL